MRNTIELMENTIKQYEVERKFLLKEIPFEVLREIQVGVPISQYYIFDEVDDSNHPSTSRIRVSTINGKNQYVKTIKRPSGNEYAQNEYETDLTKEEFLEFQKQASTKITKIRYTLEIDGNKWEFDKFLDFEMYMCEVEKLTDNLIDAKKLEEDVKNIPIPDVVQKVLIKEVTGEIKYSNKSMAVPYNPK
jgi:CYTH domain-containing protein